MAKGKGSKVKRGAAIVGKGLVATAGFLAKRGSLYGAGAQVAEEMLEEHWDYAKKKWFASPLAVLAAAASGHVVKEATPRIALAGAAGHSAALRYKQYQFQNGKRDTSPIENWQFQEEHPAASSSNPSKDTPGYDQDTGLRNGDGVFN